MNTTRKHPRTLQEAFGPYTNSKIDEPKRCLFADLKAQWAQFFAEHKKPETDESYQRSVLEETR